MRMYWGRRSWDRQEEKHPGPAQLLPPSCQPPAQCNRDRAPQDISVVVIAHLKKQILQWVSEQMANKWTVVFLPGFSKYLPMSNRCINCAALFPLGFVLSSTAQAGKLLGIKYHWDFYLCQSQERLADRLKKILWKLIDRDTYTPLRMAQNCFPKKNWTKNANGQSLSRTRHGYELVGNGLTDSLWS